MLNVICEKCLSRMPDDQLSTFNRCPVCRTREQVVIFSAIEKEQEKGESPEVVIDDNAACINHLDKAAAALCDCCGAYICSLCQIEIEGQRLCPACFNNNSGKITTLNNRTTLHDACALNIAVLPILVWPVSCITAPVAMFLSLFYWNKVETPYKRGKWRFVVACLLATAQIIGWGFLVMILIGDI